MAGTYYGMTVLSDEAPVCTAAIASKSSWPVQIRVGQLTFGLTLEAAQALYTRLWPVIMAVGDAEADHQFLQGPAPEGGSRAAAPLAGGAK